MEIMVSVIIVTACLCGGLGWCAIASAFSMVSPFSISRDGFSGYRKSFFERLCDAIEYLERV